MDNVGMKAWQTPRVARYGTFTEATNQTSSCTNKFVLSDDGFTLGTPPIAIGCLS